NEAAGTWSTRKRRPPNLMAKIKEEARTWIMAGAM
ncbi:Os05g0583551, partial [Oryza sativa Japonica Group]